LRACSESVGVLLRFGSRAEANLKAPRAQTPASGCQEPGSSPVRANVPGRIAAFLLLAVSVSFSTLHLTPNSASTISNSGSIEMLKPSCRVGARSPRRLSPRQVDSINSPMPSKIEQVTSFGGLSCQILTHDSLYWPLYCSQCLLPTILTHSSAIPLEHPLESN